MTTKTIKIGNASGYWGDDPKALHRQVMGGRLDYISMDFLAEITMSVMQKQRARDPEAGYARDFLPMLESVFPKLVNDGTCIITNAGGVNPEACAEAIEALSKKLGLGAKIAVVYGDDILGKLGELKAKGCKFDNMETGRPFSDIEDRVQAANVYFGAAPVAEALKGNPHVIITGRVTDTGITVGPMLHRLGWTLRDWDKLAAGIVAGHILECGSQATGGNFSDWRLVKSYKNMGYPIVEMHADGSFVVTKHPGTGGLVSVDTIREQLFYEMGNPKAYITPDVVADFSTIQLAQDGEDRVRVSGVKGYEPTELYKVSMAYADGAKCVGEIAICGPEARVKAEAFAKLFWERAGTDFAATETELFGYNAFHRSLTHADDGNEVILRLGVRDPDQRKLKAFGKMVPAVILGGPPGVTILGGVPRIHDIVSYWPALMPKTAIKPMVATYQGAFTDIREVSDTPTGKFTVKDESVQRAEAPTKPVSDAAAGARKGTMLYDIALARSGDKGDTANIGLMARSRKAFEWLDQNVTAQVVKDLFQELCKGTVVRYKVENMLGFNFLLEQSLGGGGTMTMRADAQGKTFAQGLLRQRFQIPDDVLGSIKK